MTDALFNDKLLDNMFDDNDVARYENGTPQKRYFGDGPGTYVCEVASIRTGVSQNDKNFGVTYFVVEFKVIDAQPGKDADGIMQPATHNVGDVIGQVKMLAGRIPVKEAIEMGAAVLRLPPALAIPEGLPHAGKVLPMVTGKSLARMAVDDGKRFVGRRVFVDVSASRGKDGGKHAGRIFYNPRFAPSDDNGERTMYPTGAQLVEKMGRDKFIAGIFEKFGDPNAPVASDDDTPF